MAQYPFMLHPRLIELLGKQLVQKDVRAIIELVKNSYDADAERVEISWEPQSKTLIVADNGGGMSLAAIKKGWLVLGSPLKLNKIRSNRKKRIVAGSKGVGRMALGSLGVTSTIESGQSGGTWRSFAFNIEQLESAAVKKGRANVDVREIPKPKTALADSGTIITISCQRDIVPDQEAHDELYRELQLLVSPGLGETGKGKFRISIDTPFGKTPDVGRVNISDKMPIHIVAQVKGKNRATIDIKYDSGLYLGTAKFEDRHDELTGVYDKIPGVRCELFWRPRGASPEDKQYWKRSEKDPFAEVSGFHVFRDFVRVQPYGDEDHDWLKMEQSYTRTGAMKRHPRPLQIFGWVEISRRLDFEDNPSREGLRSTDAFKQMRDFCDQVIKDLQAFRQVAEPVIEKLPPGPEAEAEVGKARDAAKRLEEKFRHDKATIEDLRQITPLFARYDEKNDQVALYRERTSAGMVASLVLHDSGISLQGHRQIIANAVSLECSQDYHTKALKLLNTVIPRVVDGYELLRGAARNGGYKTRTFDASQTIQEIVNHFESVLDRPLKIHFANTPLNIDMREADVWSILVNFLHNSITSGEFEHAKGKKLPPKLEITVQAKLVDQDFVLTVDDNGPGLPNRPPGWIWGRGNTTRAGGGSGLGLWIVQDIVTGLGGFVKDEGSQVYSTGARFVAAVPKVAAK